MTPDVLDDESGPTHSTTRWRQALAHPLARIVAASLVIFLSLALSFAVTEAWLPKRMTVAWPNAVAALACAFGYVAYIKWVERRAVTELGGRGALTEWAGGAALGVLLGLLTLAPLWGLGVYRFGGFGQGIGQSVGQSVGNSLPLIKQISEMLLVSVMEEILMRGVVFRIAQQAWGTRRALLLTTVLFVAGHLPGGISAVGMLVTAAASLALTAAYQLSGRLWLPMGMHFAWNYLFSAVFSVPVSGHEAKGWLHGSMSGPDWLSGGAYGIEASAAALFVWAVAAALMLRRVQAQGKFTPRLQRSV